jgi:hypothetical protein
MAPLNSLSDRSNFWWGGQGNESTSPYRNTAQTRNAGFLEGFEWGVVISRYFSFPQVLRVHFTPYIELAQTRNAGFLEGLELGVVSFRYLVFVSTGTSIFDHPEPASLSVGRFSSFPFVSPRYRRIGGRILSFPRALGDRFLPREISEGKCRDNKLAGGRFPGPARGPGQIGTLQKQFGIRAETTLQ